MTLAARPVILTTGMLLLAAYLVAMVAMPKPGGRVVVGDATHHFVQLRSLVYDGDLHFRNEYVRLYDLTEYVPGTEWIYTDLTPTGHLRNYMPIGPALLWAPLYMLLSGLQLAASWAGFARPPDGFDWWLQLTPGISGILAATLAALVTARALRGLTGEPAATIGVMAAWLGTHVVYYSLVSPAYSHAASMLTSAVFFSAWMLGRDRLSIPRLASWGALAGFCALMRWQDAIFLIVPAIEAVRWAQPPARRVLGLAAAGAAFVLVFSPQMMVWHVLYGQPFAIPQGPSFMQWTSPHPFAVLFSDNHGLLTWAPMIVVALVGLVMALRQRAEWRLPIVSVLLISWYVNAAAADWWAGEAFGARRFISLFPLFALGIAVWLARPGASAERQWSARPERERRAGADQEWSAGVSRFDDGSPCPEPGRRAAPAWRHRLAILAGLGMLNWLLLLQYQLYLKGLHDLAAYPQFWFAMWLERFIVPFRLIDWLWR